MTERDRAIIYTAIFNFQVVAAFLLWKDHPMLAQGMAYTAASTAYSIGRHLFSLFKK